MTTGDIHIRDALRQIGRAIGTKNSKLRTLAKQGATTGLLSAIRDGEPLDDADRDLLADLLAGLLDDTGKSYSEAEVRRQAQDLVKAIGKEVKGRKPRVLMATQYEGTKDEIKGVYRLVSERMNASPAMQRRVSEKDVKGWHEKKRRPKHRIS